MEPPRPHTAPPMTKLPRIYLPKPNSHSESQAEPIREMLRSPEARYHRLWEGKSAFPKSETSEAESDPSQTERANDNYETKVRSRRLDWAGWLLGSLPKLLTRSTSNKSRHKYQDEYDRVKLDEVGEFEDGLPQLGALLNRDDSFGHYRAFFPEASRLLLRRMIKMGHLVEKLQELDAADAAHVDEFRLRTIQIGGENGKKRLKLEQQLDREIREYYDFFLKFTSMKSLPRPSERMHRNLHKWMIKNRPLINGEDDFIHHINDLVSPVKKGEYTNQQDNRMDNVIDICVEQFPGSFIHRYLTGMGKDKKTGIFIFKENRFASLRMTASVILTVSLLLSPVFLLFLVSMPRVAMVFIVLGFVFGFCVLLSVATDGRLQDTLIGTAAYGAFLATFLGNMNQSFMPVA